MYERALSVASAEISPYSSTLTRGPLDCEIVSGVTAGRACLRETHLEAVACQRCSRQYHAGLGTPPRASSSHRSLAVAHRSDCLSCMSRDQMTSPSREHAYPLDPCRHSSGREVSAVSQGLMPHQAYLRLGQEPSQTGKESTHADCSLPGRLCDVIKCNINYPTCPPEIWPRWTVDDETQWRS